MNVWTERAIRKQQRRLTKPARLAKWKRKVAEARENGKFASMRNWYVIQMWTREGFTDAEMADILNLTEAEIRLEMDIARQNAR